MSALFEVFRARLTGAPPALIDFSPEQIRVSLHTEPITADAESSSVEGYTAGGGDFVWHSLAVPVASTGYFPHDGGAATDWLSEASAEEQQQWRDMVLNDDDDDLTYEAVYGDEPLTYRKISRYHPPKHYRFAGAGPFVYPEVRHG